MSLRASGSRNRRHKGYGTGYGAPFYSERRFRRNDCTLALPMGRRLLSSYRRISVRLQACKM